MYVVVMLFSVVALGGQLAEARGKKPRPGSGGRAPEPTTAALVAVGAGILGTRAALKRRKDK